MSGGRQRGFTYVAVLILVATLGAVGAAFGELTSHAVQREKERDLLFVGNEYRKAIASYYRGTPGAIKRYPQSLDDLLEDRRYPTPVRHLRRHYRDPLTGGPEWGLLRAPEGGIRGIHSLSQEPPVKSGGFAYRDRALEGAATYAQWHFAHDGDSPVGLVPPRAQETAK
jgi:type II secretory pathway pseudopilin PulG